MLLICLLPWSWAGQGGGMKHHVAACERDTTVVLPPGEVLPGMPEAEAWALQSNHTKYSCSTTGLPFLLSTE